MEGQLDQKKQEIKKKTTIASKYKEQINQLKSTLEVKTKDIGSLIEEKKQLISEREMYIEEIIQINNRYNKNQNSRYVSVLEPFGDKLEL